MIKKCLLYSFILSLLFITHKEVFASSRILWPVQSVDTMKTSRDLTLYKQHDSSFDNEIRKELRAIKSLGANYVAIDGAYDEEFIPWLSRWVKIAREEGLKVWYRGNFSGWHGWFGPKNITREQHLQATKNFILSHPELFEDGDSFTACPECEYGGPGNPLETKDFEGFRKFMLDEYKIMNESFSKIGKKVNTNWFSFNPDVAKEVLDRETVEAIGNFITLDYFVRDVKQLEDGLNFFIKKFPHAKILIGEFGAPIPEINGVMTDEQQEKFIRDIFNLIVKRPEIIGVNYWVSSGGSTALLNRNLGFRKSTEAIQDFFIPGVVSGTVTNTLGDQLKNIPVKTSDGLNSTATGRQGHYTMVIPASTIGIAIGGNKYKTVVQKEVIGRGTEITKDVVLEPEKIGFIYRIRLTVQYLKKQFFGTTN